LPTDFVWFLLPLWGLASREIDQLVTNPADSRLAVIIQAGVILILLLVSWINLASYLRDGQQVRLYFALGLALIAVIVTYLISAGWTLRSATQGVLWGLLLGFGTLMIAEMLAVFLPRGSNTYELWQIPPLAGQTSELNLSLGDLSEWQTGRRDSVEITVLGTGPLLTWELRNYFRVEHSAAQGLAGLPPVLITPADSPDPELSASYRGQVFTWKLSPAWEGLLPANWLSWLLYRVSPLSEEQIILWARSDVFPGGEFEIDEELFDNEGAGTQDLPENSSLR
jgi:hypothetical protein